ncbi:MAG: hypothetical protein R3B09_00520 [Nannocystaceae bacterium]
MSRRSPRARVEYGDWQTPAPLARAVVERALAGDPRGWAAVLEPTCGEGSLLEAAAEALPGARLRGLDRDPIHLAAARTRLGERAALSEADFFAVDWEAEVARLPEPLLIVGNPPWVTRATLGALDSGNLPPRATRADLRGLAALTGRSNFDLAEAMILRLLAATRGRASRLAMLCKASVARRVIARIGAEGWGLGGALWTIDARQHFGADVDAVLMIAESTPTSAGDAAPLWPVHDGEDAITPSRHLGLVDGRLCGDVALAAATRHLEGPGALAWRSGIKHDCAAVMELRRRDDARWINGLGEVVDVEPALLFPLLKGADLAHGRATPTRALLCPQRRLGDDTRALAEAAPRAHRYLESHRARLDARRSRIYRGRPPFAIFGVGEYTFAPWKVAIAGLYKRLEFQVVGPVDGRPVVVDDTCYFLGFADEADARRHADALRSREARDFFTARVFWDQKRPITRELLQALALERLIDDLGGRGAAADGA